MPDALPPGDAAPMVVTAQLQIRSGKRGGVVVLPVRTDVHVADLAEAAQLLGQLIALDTRNPGGDESALARRLADELEERRADDVQVVLVPRPAGGPSGAYVFARWGTPRLLVNAHLDTVPWAGGWTTAPLSAHTEVDRVVGLGAADTKGSIAAVLWALDLARPRDVAVLFSGDEERGGSCMRAFLHGANARGIERAIVCEPTGCRVGTRHRGVLAIQARLGGPGGHSSRADTLPAPVAELASVAVELDAWGKRRRASGPAGFSGMCLNVAQIEGGVAFNVVPESATLTFSVRPPPGTDLGEVREELVALVARLVPAAATSVILSNPTFITRQIEVFRSPLGAAVDAPIDLGYWTEAAMLSGAGIDAVVFGPGDVEQAHAAGEFVRMSEVEIAQQAFVHALHGSR